MANSKNVGAKKSTLEMVSDQISNSSSFESFSVEDGAVNLQDTVSNLKSATNDLTKDIEKAVSEGVQKIQKTANDYAGVLGENTAEAREQARKVLKEGEKYVKQKPVQSVLGALAIGLLVGSVMRKR